MPQIFVSYAQSDENLAVRLATDLRQYGAQTWLDILDAEPGRLWTRSIERALSESRMMMVLLSPLSLDSAHVAVEWQAYLEAHRPVIPVLAAPCSPPGPLRTRHPVDFTRESNYARSFHMLMSRLLEYGTRLYSSDPVIWTLAEDVRDFREPIASESTDLVAEGMQRMVGGLRDQLLKSDSD